ncbi:MAG: hypothetical protein IKR94_03860 [Bacteroidales bacterium]|nr:hypothetical protein [Bacteroidales bacterium]
MSIGLAKKSGEKVVLYINSENDSCLNINGSLVSKFSLKTSDIRFYYNQVAPYYENYSGIKKDTSVFKQHKYQMDTAVIRLYVRNLAQGVNAFMKRTVGRLKYIELFNYLETRSIVGAPIDDTDHYGYRYEIKIPVTGVSELTMSDLFGNGKVSYNSGGKVFLNYVVEPGDTLMFYVLEHSQNVFSQVDVACETCCSGGNYRFNAEKNASIGMQMFSGSDTFQKALENSKVPFSDKFIKVANIKRKYKKLRDNWDSDSLKYVFPISEDEVFSSMTVYEFCLDYIKQHADYLVSTPENLAQHPDWIIAEIDKNNDVLVDSKSEHPLLDLTSRSSNNKNILINPEYVKSLGFSDDFIEFFRFSHAVQFFDDFSPRSNDLTDAELQSIMQHLTKEDYKAYLLEKMNCTNNQYSGRSVQIRMYNSVY